MKLQNQKGFQHMYEEITYRRRKRGTVVQNSPAPVVTVEPVETTKPDNSLPVLVITAAGFVLLAVVYWKITLGFALASAIAYWIREQAKNRLQVNYLG